jgi:hypothetical protein
MSDDQPRDSDGQFTPAEPLLGQAGIEADLGYTQMPEPENRPEPESDIMAEVQRLQQSREQSDNTEIIEVRYQNNATGEPLPTNQTVDLDRGQKDLANYHANLAEAEETALNAEAARFIIRAQELVARFIQIDG